MSRRNRNRIMKTVSENTIRTYGVTGLMEWKARLRSGKAVFLIDFTGGTLSGYGATPATYTTDNSVVQSVIESSEPFRNGRIRLLRSVPLPAGRGGTPAVPATSGKRTAADKKDTEAATACVAEYDAADETDAADYLQANHGISPSRINSTADIGRVAASLGIRLSINGNPC